MIFGVKRIRILVFGFLCVVGPCSSAQGIGIIDRVHNKIATLRNALGWGKAENLPQPKDIICHDDRPVVLYVHGFCANGRECVCAKIIMNGSNEELYDVCYCKFPDSRDIFGFYSKKANLAQNQDIAVLKEAIEEIPTSKTLVLYGTSRGSATIITTLGSHPELVAKHNIKAIILDSPFADPKHVISGLVERHLLPEKLLTKKLEQNPPLHRFEWLVARNIVLKAYDPEGVTPLKVVTHIPQKLPIFILASTKDMLIPCNESLLLVNALHESGHEHVIFVLKNDGGHCAWTLSAFPDYTYIGDKKPESIQLMYIEIARDIAAFLKQCGLPYAQQSLAATLAAAAPK